MYSAFLLLCKITYKRIITTNLDVTTLLNVSTLSCHLQGALIHYLAKLRKYINCSCLVIQFKLINLIIIKYLKY
jgi:hypothetical protein